MEISNIKKGRIVLLLAIITIATGAVFFPSLQSGFTNWDDNVYITQSRMIRDISPGNIARFFSFTYVNQYHDYHPLTILSYAVEYKFFGLEPFIYHLTNLVIHITNCALVFWLVILITQNALAAFVTALLFGIHPLHVESVAWVAERKDVLSTCFYLGSLIAYWRYARNGRTRSYAASLVLCLLSFLSKTTAMTLPFILILCDYLAGRKLSSKTAAEKIPFLGLAAVFTVITTMIHHPEGGITLKAEIPFSLTRSIFVAFHAIVFYFAKTFVPINLSCLYPYPRGIETRIPLEYLVSPAIVLVPLGLFLIFFRKNKIVMFGLLFFVVTIFPFLQIVPTTWTIAADRYMYIPSVGIFLLIALLFAWIAGRGKACKALAYTAGTVAVAALSVLTWQRCSVWHDSVTLWSDVIRQYPVVPNIYNSRGAAHAEQGNYDAAIADYTQAIGRHANYPDAYHNRGNAWYAKEDYDRAIADYDQAVLYRPSYASAYNNRANAWLRKGDIGRAIADYTRAIEADPGYVIAYANRAFAYQSSGNLAGAVADLNAALAIDKDNPEYLYARGTAHYLAGDRERALADYSAAARFTPRNAFLYINRGYLYHLRGDDLAALADYDRALAIETNLPNLYNNRGLSLYALRRFEESVADYTRAIELNPQFDLAFNNRGNSYCALGQLDKAIDDYSAAIAVNPVCADAYNNRGIVYLMKKEYGEAHRDFLKARELGFAVNPQFLEEAEKAR